MYKTILFVTLIVCAFAVDPLAQVKNVVREDECGAKGLESLKPQIKEQIEILKQDSNNAVAKAKLMILFEQAKNTYDECGITKKVEPMLGDAVKAAGVAFLLASNCTKDVGMVLLILDTIVQDPSDITNDVIVSIFLYILGRQGVADCEQFIHFII